MKYYLLGAFMIIFDQITKIMIRTSLAVGDHVNILGDFFKISHIENMGAAFSIMSGKRAFLILIPIIICIAAVIYMQLHKGKHFSFYLAGTLIICGGIGNLIDRVLFGQVTDMLDFSIFPPVFNVADIYVTLGCFLCVIYVIFEEKLNKKIK